MDNICRKRVSKEENGPKEGEKIWAKASKTSGIDYRFRVLEASIQIKGC